MKRFVRFVCLIMVFATAISIPAYATEQSQRASNYISSYRAYCYAVSSTKIEVWFSVVGAGTMDEIGASTIKVQRSSDGTTWTTMKTYTKESYPQMIDTNSGFHGSSVTYTATPGYYYRARVEFYAKNSTGSGYMYYYTAKI